MISDSRGETIIKADFLVILPILEKDKWSKRMFGNKKHFYISINYTFNEDPNYYLYDKDLFCDEIKKLVDFTRGFKDLTFEIEIDEYSLAFFNKHKILEFDDSNNYIFKYVKYDKVYDKKTLINTNNRLNYILEFINKSNLSNYEKYLCIYNMVKEYGKKKINKKDLSSSKSIFDIVLKNYIDRDGYNNLLLDLLNRVGINSVIIDSNINDNSKLLIYLKDEKYNINGMYLADPYSDYASKKNLLNYHLITYKSNKNNTNNNFYNTIINFDTTDELYDNISDYLQKEINKSSSFKSKLHHFCRNIIMFLCKIDKEFGNKLREKYTILFDRDLYYKKDDFFEIVANFLDEYYQFMHDKNNNIVDKNTTLLAYKNMLKSLNTDDYLVEKIINKTVKDNEKKEKQINKRC